MMRITALLAALTALGAGAVGTAAPPEDDVELDIVPSLVERSFVRFAEEQELGLGSPACVVERETLLATCFGLVDGTPVAYTVTQRDDGTWNAEDFAVVVPTMTSLPSETSVEAPESEPAAGRP